MAFPFRNSVIFSAFYMARMCFHFFATSVGSRLFAISFSVLGLLGVSCLEWLVVALFLVCLLFPSWIDLLGSPRGFCGGNVMKWFFLCFKLCGHYFFRKQLHSLEILLRVHIPFLLYMKPFLSIGTDLFSCWCVILGSQCELTACFVWAFEEAEFGLWYDCIYFYQMILDQLWIHVSWD